MNGTAIAGNKVTVADLAAEPDFQLGVLQCRPSLLTVGTDEHTEALERRIMLVLVMLARHKGEVMSRDRLIAACWDGRVVTDDALQRCLVRLRKISEALGGFELETIRGVGYRLTEIPVATVDAAVMHTHAAVAVPSFAARRWRAAAPLLMVMLLLVAAIFLVQRTPEPAVETTMETPAATLATIADLISRDLYGRAFSLAQPLRADPAMQSAELEALWQQIVLPMRPSIEQNGASLWFKPYEDVNGPWIYAGVSPFTEAVDAPRGPLRLKVEKPGFRTGYFAISNPGPSVFTDQPYPMPFERNRPQETIALPLSADGALPDDLVPVPHTNTTVFLRGWSRTPIGDNRQDIPAFAIERTEVTNRQFKQFIDAGGYDNPEYWRDLQYRENGQALSQAEAFARFVDATGRPGPAGWQLSTYPSGTEDLPVSGISWYEAVAYARFRGRELPTIHHWVRAAFTPYDALYSTGPAITLQSRLGAAGPVAADDATSLGPWGNVNTAGNVREWIWNSAGNQALALGGAWSDGAMMFPNIGPAQPMWRIPQIGLRLMQADIPFDDALRQPVTLRDEPDIQRAPVSNEAFAMMRAQFNMARTQPTMQSVAVVAERELWSAEEVVLRYTADDAATFYIVKPQRRVEPLQAVVVGPPGICCLMKRPPREALELIAGREFIINGGRALVLPIWADSYERYLPPEEEDVAADQDRQRRRALAYYQDISRIIDYLETRADLDASRIGYIGESQGTGAMGAISLAIEHRIKAAVFVSGSISLWDDLHPMYDTINYAPHITAPMLLLTGGFGMTASHDSAQRLLLDLLATPSEHKARVIYDSGHTGFPPNSLARDASNWFDRYLGEVSPGLPRVASEGVKLTSFP